MKAKGRQYGVTLVEMTVVVAIVALLVSLGLPAIRALFNSFESQQGAHTLISSSLASARALAAKEQRYAGIRFQHRYDPADPNGGGAQYMIFIIHDQPKTNLSNGFRAVEDAQPIKLPDSVGVMAIVDDDDSINEDKEVVDKRTFSIVFSPSGKLVIHPVRISSSTTNDDIFNTEISVRNGRAMFLEDGTTLNGLNEEPSCNCFIVYDRNLFDKVDVTKRYSDCLSKSEPVYINPYTGTMIKR